MADKRTPTQKRSIEKKNKIIDKGFSLMCRNGYHNTTTNEIADYAKVSVGIIYQYFDDKKEIFVAGIEKYLDELLNPTIKVLEKTPINKTTIKKTIDKVIDTYIKSHTISKKAHEELEAMRHLDKEIFKIFNNTEILMTNKINKILNNNNNNINISEEKIHIIIGIVENYCHEIVYHHHKEMDYKKMKEEVVEAIKNMLY